jgi:hypothetical protein
MPYDDTEFSEDSVAESLGGLVVQFATSIPSVSNRVAAVQSLLSEETIPFIVSSATSSKVCVTALSDSI